MEPQDWALLNAARGALIDKSIAGTLTAEEAAELNLLNQAADEHLDTPPFRHSLPPEIEALIQRETPRD